MEKFLNENLFSFIIYEALLG